MTNARAALFVKTLTTRPPGLCATYASHYKTPLTYAVRFRSTITVDDNTAIAYALSRQQKTPCSRASLLLFLCIKFSNDARVSCRLCFLKIHPGLDKDDDLDDAAGLSNKTNRWTNLAASMVGRTRRFKRALQLRFIAQRGGRWHGASTSLALPLSSLCRLYIPPLNRLLLLSLTSPPSLTFAAIHGG